MRFQVIKVWMILILLSHGGEIAKWNFAQDYGEKFPDRSPYAQYDGTNGTSDLTITNNIDQSINRGIWGNGLKEDDGKFAQCPSTAVTANTFNLVSGVTTNFSLGMFVYLNRTGNHGELFAYCSGDWSRDNGEIIFWVLLYGVWCFGMPLDIDGTNISFNIQSELPQSTWTFINWHVWYEVDHPNVELYIDGLSEGIQSAAAGSFLNTALNPYFIFGRAQIEKEYWHMHGFISHVIIMLPGETDMSAYFDNSNSGLCSPLTVCMIDPTVFIPGDWIEITKTTDWTADCNCPAPVTSCASTPTDWCTCDLNCSECIYDFVAQTFSWQLKYAEIGLVEVSGAQICACNEGLYDGIDSCLSSCDTACKSCYGITDTDWISWFDGFFLSSSAPGDWSTCFPTCATCEGINKEDCNSCADPNAATNNPGEWFCNLGWFDDDRTDLITCIACHAGWDGCDGPGLGNWINWAPAWQRQPPPYDDINKCDVTCPSGTYIYTSEWVETCPNGTYQDSTKWQLCHPVWDTWFGGLQSNCITCNHPHNQLVEGICSCIPGYYQDPDDSSQCIAWGLDCDTCSDGNNWYTCKAVHAIPIDGQCTCTSPFTASNDSTTRLECFGCPRASSYDTISQTCEVECRENEYSVDFECKLCSVHCTQWQDYSHCLTCSDGHYVNNQFTCDIWDTICRTCEDYADNCTSCRETQVLDGNTWTCSKNQILDTTTYECIDPIEVSISVNEDNVITISFSEDQILTEDDISLAVYTEDRKKTDITYTLDKLKDNSYEISLTAATDDITEESTLSMDFSEDFKSQEFISQSDQTLTSQLHQQDSQETEDEKDEEIRREQVADSTSSGSMALVSTSTFFASLSYNFGALWRIINYLQIVSLFSFFNLNTTPELDGFLSSLLKDSRIPNLYHYILPDDYDSVYLPTRFKKSNYDYPLFLDTFGHTLSIWFLIAIVLCIGQITVKCKPLFCRKIGNKINDALVYNGLIRTVLETSIYIFIGWFLNFKFGFAQEDHSQVNTCLSVLALALLFSFAIFCFVKIYTNNGRLGEDQKRYQNLTKELKENTSNFSAYFNVIYLLRRALFWSVVVFIEGAGMQICLSSLLNTSHLVWLICAQPFNSRLINAVEIYSELIVVVLNFSMIYFLIDHEEKNTISSILIILIFTAIFAWFIIIIRGIMAKYCKCGAKIATENSLQNKTDDNIQDSNKDQANMTNITETENDASIEISWQSKVRERRLQQLRLPQQTSSAI